MILKSLQVLEFGHVRCESVLDGTMECNSKHRVGQEWQGEEQCEAASVAMDRRPWAASSIEEAAGRSESEATWAARRRHHVGAGQEVAIAVANHG